METKKCSLLKSVNSFLDAIGGNLSKLTVELQGLYTEWLTPKFSEMTEQSTSFERDILGHNDDGIIPINLYMCFLIKTLYST